MGKLVDLGFCASFRDCDQEAIGQLGLYWLGREIGITVNVIPAALNTYWWTVPILVFAARPAAVADFHSAPAVGFLRRRLHRDLEHAVPERGLRTLPDDALGQWNRAMELAVFALGVIVPAALLLPFVMALATQHQRVVSQLDLNLVLLQAGELGAHGEPIAVLERFDSR